MSIIAKEELEKNIINVTRGKIFTNSLAFSKEFDIRHIDVLRKIRSLTTQPWVVQSDYKESTFVNQQNRQYLYYELTRDGYMELTMSFGTPKGKVAQERFGRKRRLFIEAFNKMEQMILQHQNQEWVTSREQGKLARREETDTIKDFVEYATAQGSKNAKFYYKHITKATYKGLRFEGLDFMDKARPAIRDSLTLMQGHQLAVAEGMVTATIQKEMDLKTHYKVIYEKVKDAVTEFGAMLPQLQKPPR